MRRARLSRVAARLRSRLLLNPAFTPSPRCPRCGILCRVSDLDEREGCCRGCVTAHDEMVWDDSENEKPFLPEEEET